MFDFIANLDPEVTAMIYLVAGGALALVAKPAFAKLKSLVSKTETTLDDQLVAKLEEMVAEAVAKLKDKGTKKGK